MYIRAWLCFLPICSCVFAGICRALVVGDREVGKFALSILSQVGRMADCCFEESTVLRNATVPSLVPCFAFREPWTVT